MIGIVGISLASFIHRISHSCNFKELSPHANTYDQNLLENSKLEIMIFALCSCFHLVLKAFSTFYRFGELSNMLGYMEGTKKTYI